MHIPPLVLPLAAAIGVYIDAKAIGVRKGLLPGFFDMGAGVWGFACFLFLLIALPLYLLKRGQYKVAVANLRAQAAQQQYGPGAEASPLVWPPPPQPPSDTGGGL